MQTGTASVCGIRVMPGGQAGKKQRSDNKPGFRHRRLHNLWYATNSAESHHCPLDLCQCLSKVALAHTGKITNIALISTNANEPLNSVGVATH